LNTGFTQRVWRQAELFRQTPGKVGGVIQALQFPGRKKTDLDIEKNRIFKYTK
jgi:hypothetical protein